MHKNELNIKSIADFSNDLIDEYDKTSDQREKNNILFILIDLEDILDRGRIFRKDSDELRFLNKKLDDVRSKIYDIKMEDPEEFNNKIQKNLQQIGIQYK